MVRLSSAFNVNSELRRIARFVVVGALCTLVDLVLFALLRGPVGLPTLVANTLAYSAGIFCNYTLSRNWTYHDAQHKALGTQFAQFLIVSLSALLLNNLLVLLLEKPLGQLFNATEYGYLLAKTCATVVVVFWSFFANRFWTFNIDTKRKEQ